MTQRNYRQDGHGEEGSSPTMPDSGSPSPKEDLFPASRALERERSARMPLEDWLVAARQVPRDSSFIYWQFPTDAHRQGYLSTIAQRSDEELRGLLLRFLIPSATLGVDELRLAALLAAKETDPKMYDRMINRQYYQRLALYFLRRSEEPPWEGITWILDLLPHGPRLALDALNAYIAAHFQVLSDGRCEGLLDAAEVIRARYIGSPQTVGDAIQALLAVDPRDFEHLVERLFRSMGYQTHLTPPTKDGGRDIVASSHAPGRTEVVLVECKRHQAPVGVLQVRALLGVVFQEKANKGVLVAANRFTHQARELARVEPHLELIPGPQLVVLFSEYLGADWPLRLERLIAASKREHGVDTSA